MGLGSSCASLGNVMWRERSSGISSSRASQRRHEPIAVSAFALGLGLKAGQTARILKDAWTKLESRRVFSVAIHGHAFPSRGTSR